MILKGFLIIIFLLCRVRVFSSDHCNECKSLTKTLNDSIYQTMDKAFTGGDAEYEKKRLISYQKSETRLLEIIETITEKATTTRKYILERIEERIEEWWQTTYIKSPENFSYETLEKLICFEHFCCPSGKFGKACIDCPKCNPHGGSCTGNGTREGNGICKCKSGYLGAECNECQSNRVYSIEKNENEFIECLPCPESCKKCHGPLETDCSECLQGYRFDEGSKTCVDIDECIEETHCTDDGVFCDNTKGGFRCSQCNIACSKCSGPSENNCLECSSGFTLENSTCTDINECENDKDLCSSENEECKNKPGSFECICKEGFLKSEDGKCLPKEKNKDEL